MKIPSLKLTANAPENRSPQKERIVFQPSIFRCYVSFRESNIEHLNVFWSFLVKSACFFYFSFHLSNYISEMIQPISPKMLHFVQEIQIASFMLAPTFTSKIPPDDHQEKNDALPKDQGNLRSKSRSKRLEDWI